MWNAVCIGAFDGDDLCAFDSRREEVPRDRRLADVAGEIDDGDFHGVILERRRGLVIRPFTNAAAISLLVRGSPAKAGEKGKDGATTCVRMGKASSLTARVG
jgi:hypothetical protein